MLDQNTDRMWYVIGAVIVGAALIFLVNSSFPQLFASVGDVFTNKTDEVSETIGSIGASDRNLLIHDKIQFNTNTNGDTLVYDKKKNTWAFDVIPSGRVNEGIVVLGYAPGRYINVPFGESLTFSYEVYSDSALTMRNDINSHPIDDDGRAVPDWNGNDNDDMSKRMVNGSTKSYDSMSVPIKAKEWTKVSVTYTNSSVLNTGKYRIEDTSNLGILRPSVDNAPIHMKLRNLQIEYGTVASPYSPTK